MTRLLKLSKENSSAIISRRGAFVNSLTLDGRDILKGSTDGKQTHRGLSVLIPYADIVSNASYRFKGRKYSLPKNAGYEGDFKNSLHGLVIDKPWNIIFRNDEMIELKFILAKHYFPSVLSVVVRYKIGNSKFDTSFLIKNIGSNDAPLMCGSHPYFLFHGYWKFKFNDPIVQLNKTESQVITTKRIISDSITSFGRKQYDNAYFGGGKVEFLTKGIRLIIQRINMPFFEIYNGIYSEMRSVAFEPLTGAPNCYNNGMGLKILRKGEEFKCGFSITSV
ncbi:MAG: aldose 1-epimerase [Candidatus Parvarchaeota archaeon]